MVLMEPMAEASLADLRLLNRLGIAMAARIAITAITIRSSIRVKPLRCLRRVFIETAFIISPFLPLGEGIVQTTWNSSWKAHPAVLLVFYISYIISLTYSTVSLQTYNFNSAYILQPTF